MYTIVYLALVLAASTIALPQYQSQGFGGYSSVEQHKQSSAESSSNSGSFGYGSGGIGAYGGYGGSFGGSSHFSQESSSSYRSSEVISSFSEVRSQIAQMQSLLTSGSMSQQVAIQQTSQLASSFQLALSQAPHCGSCFGQSGFSSVVGDAFEEFTQLMTFMQSSFQQSFGHICSSFVGVQSSFQSFFQSASSSGLSLNAIIPPAFAGVAGSVMPSLVPTLSEFGLK